MDVPETDAAEMDRGMGEGEENRGDLRRTHTQPAPDEEIERDDAEDSDQGGGETQTQNGCSDQRKAHGVGEVGGVGGVIPGGKGEKIVHSAEQNVEPLDTALCRITVDHGWNLG